VSGLKPHIFGISYININTFISERVDIRLNFPIYSYTQAKLAKYEVPDDVIFWKELPMTGTGKMDKKQVRKMLSEQGYVLPSLRKVSKL